MPPQELQNQIDLLKKQVADLERISIKLNIDPTTALYLRPTVLEAVNVAVSTLPTQTYSLSSPSGSAPAGSLWIKDTGVLATNEIHVYSGSAWVRMK